MSRCIGSIVGCGVLSLGAWLAACSPALDWREFVPEGSGVSVRFPCRPNRIARQVQVAESSVTMELLSCGSGDVSSDVWSSRSSDTTFALSFFDVADPARVDATLLAWRATALANVHGRALRETPLPVAGMTSNAQAGRISVEGRLPDGGAVREEVGFFVHGRRVYQATVIGARPSVQAIDGFFSGLKFPSSPL